MKLRSAAQLFVSAFLVSLVAVLCSSCGGGGRPTVSNAARYLNQAKEYESQALEHKNKGEDAEALIMFRQALEKLDTGLKTASANERPALRTVRERIEPHMMELELREKARKQREETAKKDEEEKKRLAALGKADASKDEDAKRKAEDEAKKKEVAALAEQLKKLQTESSVKPAKAVDEDEPDKVADAGKDGADGEKKDEAPKPPPGPFKTYGENEKPPRLSVDKIDVKGEFIFAYIQIYNEGDTNKRIARPEVKFTTFQDADLCPADANFSFEAFDKTAANPLDQTNPRAFITGSSHEVFAHQSFKMVSIAQNKEKASRARKAEVTIMFDDGSTWTVRGPQDAKPTAVDGLPGL